MEEEKNEYVVIIFTKRETEEYDHFERYRIDEKLPMEKVKTYIKNYNESDKNDKWAEICENKFICQIIYDAQATYRFKNFITDMRDVLEQIHDVSRSLSYEAEELQDYLKENYPTEEEQA